MKPTRTHLRTLVRKGGAAAALVCVVAGARNVQGQPTFQLVGHPGSGVNGISADGSTIVGGETVAANTAHPFTWPAASPGLGVGLGLLAGSQSASAYAVNVDGTVIVGNGDVPFRWRAGLGLGAMPAGAQPYGLSQNGSVAVGRLSVTGALWTGIDGANVGAAQLLPVIGFNSFNYAYGANADGSVVVGDSVDAGGECSGGVMWTGGAAGPALLPCAGIGGAKSARAVSPDGTIIVGSCGVCDFVGGSAQAARWVNGVPQALGVFPGDLGAVAVALSADGSVIVGYNYTQTYVHRGTHGFVWTPSTGMLNFRPFLEDTGAILPAGTLMFPSGVSADGRVIVGNGTFSGVSQGWIVRLPPGSFDLLLLSPRNGAIVVPQPPTLSWSHAPSATSYDVTVQIGAGSPAVMTTSQTSITLPASPAFDCQAIVWGVVAHGPGGDTFSRPATRTFQTLRTGDFDRNGTVSENDIFAFLNAWFLSDPRADFNGGGLAVSDIFDFIGAWFVPCP